MTDTVKLNQSKWLKKIITFFFALGVTLNMVAPFSVVKAEDVNSSATCIEVPTNFSLIQTITWSNNIRYCKAGIRYSSNPVYIYNFQTNNYVYQVFVSESSFSVNYYAGSDSNGNSSIFTGSLDSNSGFYYTGFFGGYFGTTSSTFDPDTGFYRNPNNNGNFDSVNAFLVYLSEIGLGNSNSGISYGDIKDLSYSTNIVGSGTTTGDANIDTISWYPYWDTNDNISTTWNMEIQVVPGTWQGGTATDIFSQSYQDFIINESGAMSIYHGTYLNGSFSISWGEVKNKLSILSWADLFQYFDGTYWNKKGWVYRARFNDPDSDYWSEWQTVYTVTSSAGEGVEEFIDPSDGTGLPDFYNNAVNSYNTTSVVNNNNNVTYYYVNTPIDTNPSSDDSTQYLKEIRDTIIQIRRMIAIDNNSDTNINNDNDPWIGNPAAELYDFENSSINDFNDAVGDLPTSDLITGNKFLAASTWVRTQYETLVSNTPFEAVIIFSLLLGFGLLLIGKLR